MLRSDTPKSILALALSFAPALAAAGTVAPARPEVAQPARATCQAGLEQVLVTAARPLSDGLAIQVTLRGARSSREDIVMVSEARRIGLRAGSTICADMSEGGNEAAEQAEAMRLLQLEAQRLAPATR